VVVEERVALPREAVEEGMTRDLVIEMINEVGVVTGPFEAAKIGA
jgi:hypothetical protein